MQARLSEKLASQMNDSELDQFDQLADENDEAKLIAFLEQRFPNYQEVLQQTISEAKQELQEQTERLAEYLKRQQPVPPSQS